MQHSWHALKVQQREMITAEGVRVQTVLFHSSCCRETSKQQDASIIMLDSGGDITEVMFSASPPHVTMVKSFRWLFTSF